MENKIEKQVCTTLEQSQILLSLGLSPETSDMYHNIGGQIPSIHVGTLPHGFGKYLVPAWSFNALFELLPPVIISEEHKSSKGFPLCFFLGTDLQHTLEYVIIDEKEARWLNDSGRTDCLFKTTGKTWTESAYKLMKWCLENDEVDWDYLTEERTDYWLKQQREEIEENIDAIVNYNGED